AEQARGRWVKAQEGQPLRGDENVRRREDQEAGGHTNAECGMRNGEWIERLSRREVVTRDRTCPFDSALRIPHSALVISPNSRTTLHGLDGARDSPRRSSGDRSSGRDSRGPRAGGTRDRKRVV